MFFETASNIFTLEANYAISQLVAKTKIIHMIGKDVIELELPILKAVLEKSVKDVTGMSLLEESLKQNK